MHKAKRKGRGRRLRNISEAGNCWVRQISTAVLQQDQEVEEKGFKIKPLGSGTTGYGPVQTLQPPLGLGVSEALP